MIPASGDRTAVTPVIAHARQCAQGICGTAGWDWLWLVLVSAAIPIASGLLTWLFIWLAGRRLKRA